VPILTETANSVELSIIIVNWNSASYLRACLLSIFRETRDVLYEVIVVDNASQDGCEALIREEFPQVRFIQSDSNLGFARANNLGYSKSGGQCLLFLNPDTEVIGDALAKMLSHLRANSSVGAVGARLLNTDGSLQMSCVQAFPTICNQVLDSDWLRRLFPNWRGWGIQALLSQNGVRAEVDAISGACFMVKRNVFEQVGLFGEQYFMYSDDQDLSYKIHKSGYAIDYINDCEVVHHGGKSSSQQPDHFSDLLQRESLLRFFRGTKGSFYCVFYRITLAMMAGLRMFLVAFLAVIGRRTIQGKTPGCVLQKWAKIFGWAVGLNVYGRNTENMHSLA